MVISFYTIYLKMHYHLLASKIYKNCVNLVTIERLVAMEIVTTLVVDTSTQAHFTHEKIQQETKRSKK